MDKLFSLEGRVALVTGGSRGIGRMIAEGFLRHGAKVYISARKAEACDRTAAELSAIGPCTSLPADVSTVAGAEGLAARSPRAKPKLDILVNNAGAAWGAAFDEFPEHGWDKVVDLNLKSPFFLTRALHGALKAAGSRGAAGQGDPHRVDRRHLGQSAGDVLLRRQQGGPDPPHAAHVAAPDPGPHRGHRDRTGRVRLRHEPRRARPRRGRGQAHPRAAHRHHRRHGRRGHLPGFARGRLRGRCDDRRRRRRVARARSAGRADPPAAPSARREARSLANANRSSPYDGTPAGHGTRGRGPVHEQAAAARVVVRVGLRHGARRLPFGAKPFAGERACLRSRSSKPPRRASARSGSAPRTSSTPRTRRKTGRSTDGRTRCTSRRAPASSRTPCCSSAATRSRWR